uniref:Uncharacterized protein n=1 Tax=Amphimedon queenslandica TaxID=400682 RepID=A0A1X7UD17_AMPQE
MPAEDTPETGVNAVLDLVVVIVGVAADDPVLDTLGDSSARNIFITNNPKKEMAAGVRVGPEKVTVPDWLPQVACVTVVDAVEVEVLPGPEVIVYQDQWR